MATIVIWLIGLLFIGMGCWILLLRFEGLADRLKPHNMSIGQMTVDGEESKGYAELLRARFDHHFRRPVSIPKETGFLEVVTLDTPELFQPKGLNGELQKMTVEVSGVDVTKLIHLVNQLFKPDQWIVEGDFQTHPDRAMLALRMRRGERLIRTWYLERLGNPSDDKSTLLEQLIDDAIFQLVYDFGNKAEQDKDLQKWRHVVPAPTSFPSRASVAAYYEARGALGRYYAHGDWKDLDRALDRLRTLRGQMPEYADGLQLLGMALAEKRNDTEAIHVYEQLRLLLLPKEEDWKQLPSHQKRRLLSIDLLKTTSTAKLYTWQSTHEAIGELSQLAEKLQSELTSMPPGKERAAYSELLAHTAVQLAYTYSLYLSYIRHYTVVEVFGSPDAPAALKVSDPKKIEYLRNGPPEKAKPIVLNIMEEVTKQIKNWISIGKNEKENLEAQWSQLADGVRRKAELISRLHLTLGNANYRMAEWEDHDADQKDTLFGETFETRLKEAAIELGKADATHPNHYLVLQLLGLVYSEPRREGKYLSIAEQYFERAIRANPSDYLGHELLAGILLRRVTKMGVDLANLATIEKGLAEVQEAIMHHEISGTAHLLRAEFQTMLLEIERDETKRRELRVGLEQYINQAERFLPQAFQRPDPNLTWVSIVAATRRLGEEAEALKLPQAMGDDLEKKKLQFFMRYKEKLIKKIDELIKDCNTVEERWVAHQRVFQVTRLRKRAGSLRSEIEKATLANWREIQVPFQ
jgi:tetratricopeptide (TPR) repeat protein